MRFLAVLLLAGATLAGGGPETTLVVVNADSPVSRRVANEYARLRDIPSSHLLFLKGIPNIGIVKLDFFEKKIWRPISAHMKERGLLGQIDLISYSADFPYGVDFKSEVQAKQPIGGIASLTGATFFVERVVSGEPFWFPTVNRYARIAGGRVGKPRSATAEERALSMQADQAMRQARYREAAAAYDKLFKTFKEAPQLWYRYAGCLARLGRIDDAFDALEQAVGRGFRGAARVQMDVNLGGLRKDPRYAKLIQRMQGPAVSSVRNVGTQGFRSAHRWEEAAGPPGEEGAHYYLSTQLAYTGRWGNSVPEVLGYLRSAADSDGSNPQGTVYLCRNANVRSTTREPFFAALDLAMKSLGRRVEILKKDEAGQTGVVPMDKQDVIGAVVGTASFNWGKSGSRILPGAICEHLTSFGAHFGTPGQTKISEFLRHGAAGSSGTVMEPLSIHLKFPNPMIHAFYAEGCSLAEAFFQSVITPYQLMVAGDGLARPFAKFVELEAQIPPSPWKGTVEITPKAASSRFELWVDGRRVADGESLAFDTTQVEDGHHDVRIVAVSEDAIETRSYRKIDATVANGTLQGTVSYGFARKVRFGEPLVFFPKGAPRMEVRHGSRVVATGTTKCVVDSATVGPGPVLLVPRLLFGEKVWRARPVAIEIEAPEPLSPKLPDHPRKPGLRGMADEIEIVVTSIGDRKAGVHLRSRGDLKKAKSLELEGEFEAAADGFYQLNVTGSGALTLSVDGLALCEDVTLGDLLYVPVALAKGWHTLRIGLKPRGVPHLEVHLGGAQVLAPLKLRHWSYPALKKQPELAREKNLIQVPEDGLVITWKRTQRDIAALTLYPGGKEFPKVWEVETSTGSGKFKPVAELKQLAGRVSKGPPSFLELSFKPVRAKKIRIRPGGKKGATLKDLVVLGKKKKK